MKKTTLYLTEESAAGLRRLSAESGRPQAELVRDAVEAYLAERSRPRKFSVAGAGKSGRFQHEHEEEALRRGLERDRGWR